MKRLGYTRYGAQGGDWGAVVFETSWRVRRRRDCSVSTSTCPRPCPRTSRKALARGGPPPAGLSAAEKTAYGGTRFPVEQEGVWLCRNHGDAAANPGLRPGRFACRARCVVLRQVRRRLDLHGRRARARADAGTRCSTTSRSTGSRTTGASSARLLLGEQRRTTFNAVDISDARCGDEVFPARSTARHAAGASAVTTSSSIGTRSTRAVISQRGNSRSSSAARSERRSDRCVNRSESVPKAEDWNEGGVSGTICVGERPLSRPLTERTSR